MSKGLRAIEVELWGVYHQLQAIRRRLEDMDLRGNLVDDVLWAVDDASGELASALSEESLALYDAAKGRGNE